MARDCYVFFDMDDTLVEWAVGWREVFVHVAAEAGVQVSAEQARHALEEVGATYYEECIQKHWPSGDVRELWLDHDGQVLVRLGVEKDLRTYTERVVDFFLQPDACRLYPEAVEVLQALAERGVKLGIITGRPLADPDLERLGIIHYFNPIFDAFKARSSKDQGRMFHLAAEAAAGRSAWHVGDSYAGDVLGARSAGLRPILIDRRGVHDGVDCPKVTDLREVLGLVFA